MATKLIEIEAGLLARAHRVAEERGITVRQLVEEALERELEKGEEAVSGTRPRLASGRSADGSSAAETATEPIARPPA